MIQDDRMKRRQLKRQKNWRMAPNSRSVARGTRWGNPYIVEWWSHRIGYIVIDTRLSQTYQSPGDPWTKEQATQKAVDLYRSYAIKRLKQEPDWLDPLRGLDNVYCWCREDSLWCHGDILIGLLETR